MKNHKLQDRVLEAVNNGDIQTLLDVMISNPDLQWTKCCYVKSGDSPLHVAARLGNLEIVRCLIEEWNIPRCIEAGNFHGKTALHEAAQFSQFDVVEYLLKHGAEVNALKAADWTPLMLACTRTGCRALQTVQTLLSNGANTVLRNKDGWTALHLAAREGDPDILSSLLSADPEAVNTISRNGRTPIHTAALHGHEDVVKLLLKHNPSLVSVADSCGTTPLFDAIRSGKLSLVQLLINTGASLETRDLMGLSCVHVAAQVGDLDMINFLVVTCKQKADYKSEKCGLTPYDYAVREKHLDAADLLKKLCN